MRALLICIIIISLLVPTYSQRAVSGQQGRRKPTVFNNDVKAAVIISISRESLQENRPKIKQAMKALMRNTMRKGGGHRFKGQWYVEIADPTKEYLLLILHRKQLRGFTKAKRKELYDALGGKRGVYRLEPGEDPTTYIFQELNLKRK